MTCRDLNEYLDQGRGASLAELPAEARRHLEECAPRRGWGWPENY
jgi:hypothetical protein